MAFAGFMKGNEAAAEAAVRAGCLNYFFYPLTPQSEVGEYMVTRMPEVGGVALQAESEVSVINMVYGAAATGKRTMTSSSGCGISLMSEGLSYIASAEVPMVIVDVMRGGPGLGSLLPTQADYYQVVKGGGHGGYRMPVFGSSNVQELADNVFEAFDIAEKYRTPVAILIDPITGQMMEAVDFPEPICPPPAPAWALTGNAGRKKNVIRTGYGPNLPPHTEKLYKKYDIMREELQRWEECETEDADIILVGFGIVGRICKTVVKKARQQGLKVGLIRPITLWPFPEKVFARFEDKQVDFLTIEMNYGQMVEDVIIAAGNRKKVHFMRAYAALIPKVDEIFAKINEIASKRS
jgi:2-oxoglutarate/2-oxoacid ferredoxin oxidoreductase subunit alpha